MQNYLLCPSFTMRLLQKKINGKGESLYILPMYLQNRQEEWLIRIADIAISAVFLFLALPIVAITFFNKN